ncbi:MAG: acetyl-CoA carboxylase biotin carboxyl carrier protein subunit [Saprospiraceae bacterium]
MTNKFHINETYEIQPDTDLLNNVDIQPIGNGQFHVLKNNKSFDAEVVETDLANRQLTLLVNGSTYKVSISDEYDELVKKLGLSVSSGQTIKEIKAPMPGLVLDVMASSGQEVKKGDALLILEAMKMENVIKSTGDATVKAIRVSKSDTIDKGEIMITFE